MRKVIVLQLLIHSFCIDSSYNAKPMEDDRKTTPSKEEEDKKKKKEK